MNNKVCIVFTVAICVFATATAWPLDYWTTGDWPTGAPATDSSGSGSGSEGGSGGSGGEFLEELMGFIVKFPHRFRFMVDFFS